MVIQRVTRVGVERRLGLCERKWTWYLWLSEGKEVTTYTRNELSKWTVEIHIEHGQHKISESDMAHIKNEPYENVCG